MQALPHTPIFTAPAAPAASAGRPLLTVLARRARLFATIVGAVILLTALATVLSPKSYTTHVTFIAGGGANNAGDSQTSFPVLNAILDISAAQSSETYAEILRQPKTVALVIENLGLHVTPGQLLGHIQAKPIPNTSILDAAVTWSSPEESARIANALARGYVDLRRDLVTQQAAAAAATIAAELASASTRMRASADALMRYQSQNGIADLPQQTNAVLGSLAALDVKASTTKVDLEQASAQLAVVHGELAQTSPLTAGGEQVAANPIDTQLRAQLATVDVQLKTARQQYTDDYPSVKALIAQERELLRAIATTSSTTVASNSTIANPLYATLSQQAATLTAQIAADRAQRREIERQRAALRPAIEALPTQAAALGRLTREAKVDQETFDALQRKYGEAKIAAATTLSDVTIVTPADPANAETHPNVIINLGVGIVLALFLGIAGIVLAERFDQRISSEDDLVGRLRLPNLASIPFLPSTGAVPAWMQAARIDAVLQLVTALRYASTARLRTIAFTSARARDGKSVVALETAVALAELEPRVLLIDADLRRPSLHTQLGLDRARGLSDVLVGAATIDDAIRRTRHAGLDVLTAGTPVPHPFVLLQSAAYEQLVTTLMGRYTTVLFDTPACGAVVDAAVICARADGTVFVVSANDTDATEAARGIARLTGGGVRRIIGTVFNRVKPRRSTIGPYGQLTDGVRSFPILPSAQRNGGA